MSAKITIETISPQVIRLTLVADIQISADLSAFACGANSEGAPSPEGTAGVQHQLLNVDQAAEALRVSRDKLYNLIRTGQLRSMKIGRLRRISTEWIVDFIAQLETRSTSATP
jgi:excisionase family DNA binding protein